MKIIWLTILITCLVLEGCLQTEGTIDIEGKILDEYTKKEIPNRKIIVTGLIFSDPKQIPIEVGQFYTDSLGRFTYTMKKVKGAFTYNFSVVGDSSYSFLTQEIFLAELERNSKFLSFNLSKLTNLTIKIERCSKTPPYDTLYVSWKTDGIEGKTIFPPKISNFGVAPDFEFRWIGGKVKSVIETKTIANKKTVICWELFRNGKVKEILDTILCERDVNSYSHFKY